jgi:hypothetical protein
VGVPVLGPAAEVWRAAARGPVEVSLVAVVGHRSDNWTTSSVCLDLAAVAAVISLVRARVPAAASTRRTIFCIVVPRRDRSPGRERGKSPRHFPRAPVGPAAVKASALAVENGPDDQGAANDPDAPARALDRVVRVKENAQADPVTPAVPAVPAAASWPTTGPIGLRIGINGTAGGTTTALTSMTIGAAIGTTGAIGTTATGGIATRILDAAIR